MRGGFLCLLRPLRKRFIRALRQAQGEDKSPYLRPRPELVEGRGRIPHGLCRSLLLLAFLATAPVPGLAVEPDEILDDPVLEARAREISAGLRCLVCQNESIDSSNAGLARDLRILVRERLLAGDSDEQVRAFMVARYGDFVLLKPPVKPETYLLWFGPGLILVLGAIGVGVYLRRRAREAAGAGVADPAGAQIPGASLSAQEQDRLERLLGGADDDAAKG